jgi:hypothetical protein
MSTERVNTGSIINEYSMPTLDTDKVYVTEASIRCIKCNSDDMHGVICNNCGHVRSIPIHLEETIW